MPSRSELEGMTRAELDALASSVGLEPTDYSTKTEVVDALEQSGGVEIDTFVADATIVSALARLTADLGPGQILIADPALAVVADNQAALLAHAKATNRVALISCADGNAAALTAVATALKLD